MGSATSATLSVAEIYDLYSRVLQGVVPVKEALTHIHARLEEIQPHICCDYPNIALFFPEAAPIIHLNQVYSTEEGAIHVVICLTPFLATNTPYVLVSPGETFGTLPNNPLTQANYLPKALKWLPLVEGCTPHKGSCSVSQEICPSETSTRKESSSKTEQKVTESPSISLVSRTPNSSSLKTKTSSSDSTERHIPVQWDMQRNWNHPLDLVVDTGNSLELYTTDKDYTLLPCDEKWRVSDADSGAPLNPGKKLRMGFQKKGTYWYTEKNNPQMRLRVKVV